MPSRVEEPETRSSAWLPIALALGLVVGGGLVYRHYAPPADPSELDTPASASATGITPPPPARCTDVDANGGYVVGEPPAQKPASSNTPGLAPPDVAAPDDGEDPLAPFAVVLGRAASNESGFAVGALREGDGGMVMSVVLLDADAKNGRTVKLARSRGDLEPPVVVVDADGALAAMVEPNASELSIKLARVRGDKVEWGAEVRKSHSDSVAIDLATSGNRGALAWDEVKGDASRVVVATFGLDAIGTVTAPHEISPKDVDADSARLVSRKGGYFVFYLAHGSEIGRPAEAEDRDEPSKNANDKKKDRDEIDESKGEKIVASWIEAQVLDEAAASTGSPLRITPPGGRIAGFDVIASGDGALVAWRDDESPSGAGGGMVKAARVELGGASEKISVAEGAGDGVPVLMPGWLSIPTLKGPDMLVALDPEGKTSEPFEAEPSIGRGEVLAAFGDRVLLGEPAGKAMKLRVMRCGPKLVPPKPADSAEPVAPP